MKRFLRSAIPVVSLALFIGCAQPGSTPPVNEPPAIAQVDDLFVDAGGGLYRFTTNDSAYWGAYGYTLWALKGVPQTPFTHREVEMCKSSGDTFAGYGIVICHYEDPDPGVGETMLVVMINTKQEYIVGEVIGAEFTEIVPWTYTPVLRSNLGQMNTMRVDYDSGLQEYVLFLNSTEVKRFRDDETPFHTGGGDNGYIVVISPLDDFPNVAVDVSFRDL